jgi:predicted PurR-regulated permease PerM
VINKNQLSILLLTVLLLWGALLVLAPFLSAICWAIIVAVVTWPLYERLQGFLGKRPVWSALLMTLLVFLGVFLPLTFIGLLLVEQAIDMARAKTISLDTLSAQINNLVDFSKRVPFVGPQLYASLQDLGPQLQEGLRSRIGGILTLLASVGQQVTQSFITLGLTVFISFFFYNHGDTWVSQTQRSLYRLGGEPLASLLDPLANTVRAVVLGLTLTAAVQGFLAGLGLWGVGIEGAVIWGLITTLLAIIQIPTLLVWLPWALWLLFTGQLWQGIALLAWGALVVSTIDNVLKPIFISQGAGIPFLVVLFGVLGGVLTFGPLGVILGPVILSVLLTLWQRWVDAGEVEEHRSPSEESSSKAEH